VNILLVEIHRIQNLSPSKYSPLALAHFHVLLFHALNILGIHLRELCWCIPRHQNEFLSCNCIVLVTENTARSEIWWNECYVVVICFCAKQLLIGNAERGVLSRRTHFWGHSSGSSATDFFSSTFQNVFMVVIGDRLPSWKFFHGALFVTQSTLSSLWNVAFFVFFCGHVSSLSTGSSGYLVWVS